jgi:solute carrier family 39 (zinc transporter), member 9
MIIFIALLLHKAPSAFGLTTFLIKEGQSKKSIRAALLIFSLAAPMAALLTSFCISLFGVEDTHSMMFWTGVVLLFSAGTFLYVATIHILPEIYNNPSSPHDKRLAAIQIILVVLGIFTPALFSVGHHH